MAECKTWMQSFPPHSEDRARIPVSHCSTEQYRGVILSLEMQQCTSIKTSIDSLSARTAAAGCHSTLTIDTTPTKYNVVAIIRRLYIQSLKPADNLDAWSIKVCISQCGEVRFGDDTPRLNCANQAPTVKTWVRS